MSVKTDMVLLSPDIFGMGDLGAACQLVREAGGESRGIFNTPFLRGFVYSVEKLPATEIEALLELGALHFE